GRAPHDARARLGARARPHVVRGVRLFGDRDALLPSRGIRRVASRRIARASASYPLGGGVRASCGADVLLEPPLLPVRAADRRRLAHHRRHADFGGGARRHARLVRSPARAGFGCFRNVTPRGALAAGMAPLTVQYMCVTRIRGSGGGTRSAFLRTVAPPERNIFLP